MTGKNPLLCHVLIALEGKRKLHVQEEVDKGERKVPLSPGSHDANDVRQSSHVSDGSRFALAHSKKRMERMCCVCSLSLLTPSSTIQPLFSSILLPVLLLVCCKKGRFLPSRL